MRRLLLLLTLLALVVAACGDDGGSTTAGPASSTSTSTVPGSTSTTTSTTSTTTTEPQGMCGDLIPVVTDQGTNCVDPDAPVTTTLSPSQLEWPGADFWEGTIPPLLVADGTRVSLLVFDEDDKEAFTVEPILETPHPVFDIRQASDGTIFTQEIIEDDLETFDHVVAVYRPGQPRVLVDGAIQLFDVAIVDGIESAIIGRESTDELGYGGVVVRPVDALDVDTLDFGLAAEAEFWVTQADYAGDRLVYTAVSDLTENVGYRGAAGATFTPTDGIEYNAPPFVTAASLSADGQTVYWVEGPDWDGRINDFEGGWVAAEWTLLGADVATGDVSLSWPLSEPVADTGELNIESVVDLGDHVLVNRSTLVGTDSVFPAALVLDFTYEEPWLRELPIPGVATPAAT